MNPAVARQRLERMCAINTDPVLTSLDIELLLLACRRADSNGRFPPDADWVPSYHLNWAASEAWAWKAGISSDRYRYKGDNTELERHQVHQHCLKMADMYRKRASDEPASVRMAGPLVANRQQGTFPWWYALAGN